MTYGLEVVIPTKVRMPISKTNDFEQKSNNLTLSKKLDMVEENREVAMIKLVEYQQMISCGYNKNVKTRNFVPRDLVLRKFMGHTRYPS